MDRIYPHRLRHGEKPQDRRLNRTLSHLVLSKCVPRTKWTPAKIKLMNSRIVFIANLLFLLDRVCPESFGQQKTALACYLLECLIEQPAEPCASLCYKRRPCGCGAGLMHSASSYSGLFITGETSCAVINAEGYGARIAASVASLGPNTGSSHCFVRVCRRLPACGYAVVEATHSARS
jgi:hypothetical protein